MRAPEYIPPNGQESTRMFPKICYEVYWLRMLRGIMWNGEFSGLINLGKVLPKKLDFFTVEQLRAFYRVKCILNLQEGI